MVNANDINLNLYRTFLTVADSESYAEAAEKLCVSERIVSANIKSLEEQLGVQLIYRRHKGTNKALKLTEFGEDIYIQSKKAINSFDFIPNLIEGKNSLENGKLFMGCLSHIAKFYLREKLIKLYKDYPNIQISLDTESNTMQLIDSLKNNKIDFAILDIIPKEYQKDLKVEEIETIDNIFVANKNIKVENIEQLTNYKYILNYEDRNSTIELSNSLKDYDISLNAILRCPTTEDRINAALDGIGIAYVMKDAVSQYLKSKELYEIKVPIELPKNHIKIAYIENQLTKVDKQFIKKYLR